MCKERQRLFDKFQAELRTYTRDLQSLCDVVGSIPHVEFMLLWKTVQHAGERFREAQRLLLKHIEQHGC